MGQKPGVSKTMVSAGAPILIWFVILFGCLALGCGVKRPPLPPRQPPLPAVVTLGYQVAGPSVRLTWQLSEPPVGEPQGPAAFGVYRFRSALAEPVCDTCPLVFEKVGMVPYAGREGAHFSFDADLDPGYRYVFTVRLEKGAATGPNSNRVQFDH